MRLNRHCRIRVIETKTTASRRNSSGLMLEYEALERWMSGLSHTPGKRAWG